MKFLYTLVFSLLFLLTASAQVHQLDSLSLEFNKANTDSSRIKIQLQIAELLKNTKPDSSLILFNKAIDLSQVAELPELQFLALDKLVSFFNGTRKLKEVIETCNVTIKLAIQQGDSMKLTSFILVKANAFLNSNLRDSALISYKKAIEIGEKIKAYDKLGQANNNMGVLYIQQGLFDLASKSLIKSIEFRKQGGIKIKASSLLNIGLVYKETNNLEEALAYTRQALALSIEEKDRHMQGMSYQNLGALLTNMERLEEAIQNLNKANEINLELNDSSAIMKYYIGVGDIYRKQSKIEECIENYLLAKSYFPSYGEKRQFMYINLDLANAYYLKSKESEFSDMNLIVDFAQKAYNLSDELGLYKNKSESAALLFKLLSKLGKEKQAIYYVNEHLIIQDSLFSTEKINALTETQTKYETEKKELEIQLLEKDLKIKNSSIKQVQTKERQKTFLLMATLIILTLSVIFSIFTYRLFKQKKKANETLESKNNVISIQKEEREMLLKEIHHRVKNNLQVISSLLDIQSQDISDKQALSAVEDGQSRVKAMALIHEKLYQNKEIGEIVFEDYVNQLIKQLSAVYALSNRANFKIKGNSIVLDIDTAIPIGLILNELISNAFKYAFVDIDLAQLDIELLEQAEGEYLLTVKDNGKGLPEDFQVNKAKSLGLRLVHRLSRQLYGKVEYNYEQGANFRIEFKDTQQRKRVS
ncbi:MAG: tetratricopeptide repeat protein [Flavobacteriales bacterium]|nr:tetratricopeptide repeat protein [Flavobacteriales bacterium]